MKVALAFPGCHRRGGVERIVFECAKFLAGREHEVTVYASEWEANGNAITYEPIRHRAWPAFLRAPSFLRESTRRLREKGYDVLGSFGCESPLGGVYWAASIHRAWLDRAKSFRSRLSVARWKQRLNPVHPVLLRMEKRHLGERTYRKLIALTPEVKDDLRFYYGVPEDDIILIPSGFSPSEFNPACRAKRRDSMRAMLGLAPSHVALLFVANELERKGYKTVLAAMRELRCPYIRLIVVGRCDVRLVKNLAARFGVADQVIACGSTDDVASFHAAGDIFVLPTQYEAFCLAILEALGSGLPVITTKIPGAQNAILPGINGDLIDDPQSGSQLAEAIALLLDNERRSAYAAGAPKTVVQYQWPSVLQQYEKVLISAQQ